MNDLFSAAPPPAPPRPAAKRKPVHLNHWCDAPGCLKWGAFGRARVGRPTKWLCEDHRAGKAPNHDR